MKRALPYALFAALTLAVFWPFIVKGHTLYEKGVLVNQLGIPEEKPGGWFQSETAHVRIADNTLLLPVNLRIYNEGLKEGELRLWNPYLFCGYPIYSNPMVQPFYPPNLILHRIFSPDTGYQLGLLLHFLFAGITMYWLLRGLGNSLVAATVGGLVWMLFGYNALWFSTGIMSGVLVFGPLAFLAIARGLEKGNLGFAALAACAMGLAILGSHPQHALNLFLCFVGGMIYWAARERSSRSLVGRFGMIFCVLTVGVGLVAVLTRLDTIANGYRVPGETFEVLYSQPAALFTHVSGALIGKTYFPNNPILEYEFTFYAGLAVCALAILGAVRGFGDKWIRYFSIFCGAAILVAFLGPLAWVFQKIPLLNLSPPSRWLFVAGFCASILAARGVDEFEKKPGHIPMVLAILAGAFWIACLLGIGPISFSNGAALETAIGFTFVAVAAWIPARMMRFRVSFLFAAVLLELLPFFLLFNQHSDTGALQETPESVKLVANKEKQPWRGTGAFSIRVSPQGDLFAPDLSIGNNLLANFGVENVSGFEAIVPIHYVRFCVESGGMVKSGGRGVHYVDFSSPLLDAAGLGYLFLPPKMNPGPRFRMIKSWNNLAIFWNRRALPRAYMISRIIGARDQNDAARLMKFKDFDPHTMVVIESQEVPPNSSGGRINAQIKWLERKPNRLKLEVTTPESGILVISETDYPGWVATVNGNEAPIYRANLAFRGIVLMKGKNEVEMTFLPQSARNGLIGSIAFLLLSLGYGIWALRRTPAG